MQIRRNVLVVAACAALVAVASVEPHAAGDVRSETIEKLEQRVERLARELAEVRAELAALRGRDGEKEERARVGAPRAADARMTVRGEAPSGDAGHERHGPELSIVGDLFLIGGNHRHEELQAGHVELGLRADLDRSTFVQAVLGFHGDGRESWFGHDHGSESEHGHHDHGNVEVEEAYVGWTRLPGAAGLTVGKKRQTFGVLNRRHMHDLDQADLPWVLQESFGDHGLTGTGLSVGWRVPKLWSDADELTVELTNGDNATAFAGDDWEHPTLSARLASFWALGVDGGVAAGLSAARGSADPHGHLDRGFYAFDLTYGSDPTGHDASRGSLVRGMVLNSRVDLPDGDSRSAWGGYVYGQCKLVDGWVAGLRYDRVDDPYEEDRRSWGFTPYVTFWQSDLVRLRAQAGYRKDSEHGVDRQYLLQLTVAAGCHDHEHH